MKRTIILLAALAFVCVGCIRINESKDLQEEVEQLKKDVAELQKNIGIQPVEQTDKGSTESAAAKSEPKAENQTASVSNEQRAIQAVEYCLKMYKSELKYDKITSVPKSDGTIDVIIDYKHLGSIEHTYYNVSVFKNGECCVNDISGLYVGRFPYGDKFSIQ
jgi:hypothetical protein